MKNVYMVVISMLFIGAMNTANAGCVGPNVMGNCASGTEIRGYGSSNDSYQGSSGQSYSYDLSNPADSNRYSIDVDAQRRDQQNSNSINTIMTNRMVSMGVAMKMMIINLIV